MLPKLKAMFFAQPGSDPPSQPVRDWLKGLPREERLEIGGDIQAVQFGWPLGLPLVRQKTPPDDLRLAEKRWKKIKP